MLRSLRPLSGSLALVLVLSTAAQSCVKKKDVAQNKSFRDDSGFLYEVFPDAAPGSASNLKTSGETSDFTSIPVCYVFAPGKDVQPDLLKDEIVTRAPIPLELGMQSVEKALGNDATTKLLDALNATASSADANQVQRAESEGQSLALVGGAVGASKLAVTALMKFPLTRNWLQSSSQVLSKFLGKLNANSQSRQILKDTVLVRLTQVRRAAMTAKASARAAKTARLTTGTASTGLGSQVLNTVNSASPVVEKVSFFGSHLKNLGGTILSMGLISSFFDRNPDHTNEQHLAKVEQALENPSEVERVAKELVTSTDSPEIMEANLDALGTWAQNVERTLQSANLPITPDQMNSLKNLVAEHGQKRSDSLNCDFIVRTRGQALMQQGVQNTPVK